MEWSLGLFRQLSNVPLIDGLNQHNRAGISNALFIDFFSVFRGSLSSCCIPVLPEVIKHLDVLIKACDVDSGIIVTSIDDIL
jgi:hypothetical protein